MEPDQEPPLGSAHAQASHCWPSVSGRDRQIWDKYPEWQSPRGAQNSTVYMNPSSTSIPSSSPCTNSSARDIDTCHWVTHPTASPQDPCTRPGTPRLRERLLPQLCDQGPRVWLFPQPHVTPFLVPMRLGAHGGSSPLPIAARPREHHLVSWAEAHPAASGGSPFAP